MCDHAVEVSPDTSTVATVPTKLAKDAMLRRDSSPEVEDVERSDNNRVNADAFFTPSIPSQYKKEKAEEEDGREDGEDRGGPGRKRGGNDGGKVWEGDDKYGAENVVQSGAGEPHALMCKKKKEEKAHCSTIHNPTIRTPKPCHYFVASAVLADLC